MRKLILAVAVTVIAAFGADNSLGTWKLNVAKSKYSPAPMPLKSLTSTREAADGGVKVTNVGERTDGAINASFTAKYDGSPAAVTGTGAPYDTISIKQVNANEFTDERKKTGGSYHAAGHVKISKDGKTMTWTSTGIDANGKKMKAKFVYEK